MSFAVNFILQSPTHTHSSVALDLFFRVRTGLKIVTADRLKNYFRVSRVVATRLQDHHEISERITLFCKCTDICRFFDRILYMWLVITECNV